MPLADIILQFTKYCKTGKRPPSVLTGKEGLKVYHQRVHETIKEHLAHVFRVTKRTLSAKQWDEITSEFIAKEEINTPYISKMPGVFLAFARKGEWDKKLGIPHLIDLLDFEWLEIEIYMMPDPLLENYRREGKTLDDVLYINPESRFATYSYPIFERISAKKPPEKGVFPLMAYRHPETGKVHFVALSSFYLRTLDLINTSGLSAREALALAANEFSIPAAKALKTGERFLSDLLDKQAIYGFLDA